MIYGNSSLMKMPTGLEQAVIINDDLLQSIVVSKSTSCSYWWFEFSKCRKLLY